MIEQGDGKPMLEGMRIVDLTSVVFGPYATQILADLGAEVIKIEGEGGDALRWSQRAAATPGMAPTFISLNSGKKSIKLDLKQPDDLTVLHELLAGADAFVTNVRGKALERLGLGYEAVKEIEPGIVYAHCVGFGQDGPYADLQAYDDVIQAASGTTSLLPRVDGNPQARYLPSLIADKVAGLHAAYAILAALVHKLRTGEGQFVEVPMFEAFTHFMMVEHLGGLTFDPPVGEECYTRQVDPDRQPFPTKDGFISIVPYTDESWFRVFELLGEREFLDDERFADRKLRVKNMAVLYRRMGELSRNFTTAELLERCHAAQIPAQEARDISTILKEPHLVETGFFERTEHPTEGTLNLTKHPVRFGTDFQRQRLGAPHIGENGEEVLASLARRKG